MKVKFKKLVKNAITPSYNGKTDAGIDFYALEDGEIPSQTKSKLISTGIAWEPQTNIPFYDSFFKVVLKLEGRSGLGKKGIDVFGGVVDQDYRGEIKVIIVNLGDKPVTINRGDRIAQLVIAPVSRVGLNRVESLEETVRGGGEFGHTGVKGLDGDQKENRQ